MKIISVILSKLKQFFVEFSEKDLIYLFVIICLLMLMPRGCGRKDPNIEIKKPTLQPTEQKTDKKGTSYTEVKGTIYTQEQMNEVKDSFQKVMKKGKVIQVITAVTAPVHDTVQVPVYVDTFHHIMSASDSTKFYKQTFTGNWKTKQGQFTFYLAPDTATYVTTWKTHWFKRDELTANVYHTDTLFKPVAGYIYTAKAPKPIVDFDLFLGYNFLTNKPVIAIGAGLHVFSIKSKN
jgi:hypothetical protein